VAEFKVAIEAEWRAVKVRTRIRDMPERCRAYRRMYKEYVYGEYIRNFLLISL
jgi:hypothetical protein